MVGIIGSGSWGTALAQVLVDNGVDCLIYGIDPNQIEDINLHHRNEQFFPGVVLSDKIKATADFSMVKDCDTLLLAVPSGAIKDVCKRIDATIEKPVLVVNVAKGFDEDTGMTMIPLIKSCFSKEHLIEVVSILGPSHAEEVVIRLLTTVCAISEDDQSALKVQRLFSNGYFRVYHQEDTIGAEIGTAVKNIMGIASGIVNGLGLGDNAKAGLMTRGLAEMARYGIALKAKPITFLGLAGVGDLIVTCTSHHSRNYMAGYEIGQNDGAESFWKNNTKTVEGVAACKIVYHKAKELGVNMPITDAVYQILYNGRKPSEMISLLMERELTKE